MGFSVDHLFFSCLDELKTWMPNNFLQLNENKTEVLLLGSVVTNITIQF